MRKISKIIGTGLLAGVMLTGCLKNATPNESKLEKIINSVNIENIINDRGREYPIALEEKITSLDNYEEQTYNEDEVMLNDEKDYSGKTFNLYEELSKKNTSIQISKEYHSLYPDNTVMGFDIMQDNDRDYLVYFIKTTFYDKKTRKPSELTIIDGKWEINKDGYKINDGNEHIFPIDPPGYNGYVLFIDDGDDSVIYNGFYDVVWKASLEKNSPLKNNGKYIVTVLKDDGQPYIGYNDKEYEIPLDGRMTSAGGTADYQGR